MASISTSISLLQLQSLSPLTAICNSEKHRVFSNSIEFRTRLHFDLSRLKPCSPKSRWVFKVRALGNSEENSNDRERVGGNGAEKRWTLDSGRIMGRLRGTVNAIPPVVFTMRKHIGKNFAIGLFITIAFLVIAVRQVLSRRTRYNQQGSVADLVKRGQLRSDRRGISSPLKYDDPFNNPLVKIGKSNSTIEMCGKLYRLSPVTLTKEQQSGHQKRRSRAYQWKRPTIFLKEGDPIPPDVDPDTVRWIPANHPFATTVNDIDEDLAQNNVYQKDGVPFRIRAEHEALQKKLEALQSQGQLELNSSSDHTNTSKSDGSFESNAESEELKKP
eukprot:TRINITY_DN8487_c0_g2_i2.p1 TRINITY_DN8487_c0_g2~~TRINITY_DN8487_c0_g2_i2.p1  ORF type:complete len:330 (+),score=53.49 TRINITY_DN8487_c0_g2_i2:132-1121(+)